MSELINLWYLKLPTTAKNLCRIIHLWKYYDIIFLVDMLGYPEELSSNVPHFKNYGSSMSMSKTSDYTSIHYRDSLHSIYQDKAESDSRSNLLTSAQIPELSRNSLVVNVTEDKKYCLTNSTVRYNR